MSKDNQYVITNPNANRVCNLSGLNVARKKRLTFRALKTFVEQSLKEAEAENRRAQFIDSALLVLKSTKATCDAFIGLAADLASFAGVEKPAKLVKTSYGVTSVIAETAATEQAGGDPDYAMAAAKLVKEASGFADAPVTEYLVSSAGIKSQLVISAVNSDVNEVKKSSVDYGIELSKFGLESSGNAGAGKAAKLASIAKTSFDYHEALGKAFDEALKAKEETAGRFAAAKSMFLTQARRLQGKLNELDQFIQSCEAELQQGPVDMRLR